MELCARLRAECQRLFRLEGNLPGHVVANLRDGSVLIAMVPKDGTAFFIRRVNEEYLVWSMAKDKQKYGKPSTSDEGDPSLWPSEETVRGLARAVPMPSPWRDAFWTVTEDNSPVEVLYFRAVQPESGEADQRPLGSLMTTPDRKDSSLMRLELLGEDGIYDFTAFWILAKSQQIVKLWSRCSPREVLHGLTKQGQRRCIAIRGSWLAVRSVWNDYPELSVNDVKLVDK